MNKEQYQLRQQMIMRKLISVHTKPVYNALQSQMKKAAAQIRRDGLHATYRNHFPLNHEIGTAVMNLYADAAARAKKAYVLTKRFGGGGSNRNFINQVVNYFKKFLLQKVVEPISNTTKDIIDRTIENAIQNGWGAEKTAKYLETTDITKNRARLIIRTESVAATNYAQMTAADNEVYQVEKTWMAIEDGRTRVSHSHAGVDGQVQDLDKPFSNGLLYPGDPSADAAEVCNCRCTMGYRIKRFTNGDPVPK